jgi:hypothetical protein
MARPTPESTENSADAQSGTAPTKAGASIAIMQPYFFPYAGYFRLFAAADLFVILDCVQFPRRGRVHRCELIGPGGAKEWLTLPLARQPRDVLIRDLAFASDARGEMDRRLTRHPWIRDASGEAAETVRRFLDAPLESVADYLETGLRLVGDMLGFPVRFCRSSEFRIAAGIHGEERILAIAKAAGASSYINLSGGRELYHPSVFAEAGIALRFLTPYDGHYPFMLSALMQQPIAPIAADIRRHVVMHP